MGSDRFAMGGRIAILLKKIAIIAGFNMELNIHMARQLVLANGEINSNDLVF
jgi:hypothetical protein